MTGIDKIRSQKQRFRIRHLLVPHFPSIRLVLVLRRRQEGAFRDAGDATRHSENECE